MALADAPAPPRPAPFRSAVKPTAVRIRASDWLTVRPKTVQVRQGQHVTLECDVTGAKPAAGVTWQRDGDDVTPGES